MTIKIRIPKGSEEKSGKGLRGLPRDPLLRAALVVFLILAVSFTVLFSYFYIKYDRIIEKRFRTPVFANSAKIYALPRVVRDGEKIDAREIAIDLRRAGYSEQEGQSKLGTFHVGKGAIEITPGPESYHSPEPAQINFEGGQISHITSRGSELSAYELEPQLVTALFDAEQRSKREVVKYNEIPTVMVQAVLAIEDRRFFEHSGVNFLRTFEAVWEDVLRQRRAQGGSTLTQQLARGFFLTPEKSIKRKLTEMIIAEELEQKFSKQQIFEFYANWVPLGQRGSFAISGLAEASQSYFNRELKDITLPEAALLAGIIQRPSWLSPYRHPERALERRNLVLDAMVETHAITREQADKAKAVPLKLAPPNVEASDAPYFVDMVRDTLVSKFNENELNDSSYRIYTTLDPDLQKAAAQAVESGIKLVDEQVKKMRTKKVKVGKKYEIKVEQGPQAQVAVVVLDPHTGAVLALVGGRDYGWSQLNHAVAKRPTGSIFKPFVYAAAMNTALDGSQTVITPASVSHRRADQLCVRRSDLRAAQLQRGISRGRDAALRSGDVAEQCDGEGGGGSWVRQGGGPGEVGGDPFGKSDAGDGIGFVRCVSVGHGGRIYVVCERGRAVVSDSAAVGAERQGRRCRKLQHGRETGARSADCLRHDEHDGRRHQQWSGIYGSAASRVYSAGGGKDGQLA